MRREEKSKLNDRDETNEDGGGQKNEETREMRRQKAHEKNLIAPNQQILNHIAQIPTRSTHQPRQRQPIPKARHRRLEVTRMEVLIDPLRLHRRVHVRPNQRNSTARDAPALVRDLDGDVFFAFNDDDLGIVGLVREQQGNQRKQKWGLR